MSGKPAVQGHFAKPTGNLNLPTASGNQKLAQTLKAPIASAHKPTVKNQADNQQKSLTPLKNKAEQVTPKKVVSNLSPSPTKKPIVETKKDNSAQIGPSSKIAKGKAEVKPHQSGISKSLNVDQFSKAKQAETEDNEIESNHVEYNSANYANVVPVTDLQVTNEEELQKQQEDKVEQLPVQEVPVEEPVETEVPKVAQNDTKRDSFELDINVDKANQDLEEFDMIMQESGGRKISAIKPEHFKSFTDVFNQKKVNEIAIDQNKLEQLSFDTRPSPVASFAPKQFEMEKDNSALVNEDLSTEMQPPTPVSVDFHINVIPDPDFKISMTTSTRNHVAGRKESEDVLKASQLKQQSLAFRKRVEDAYQNAPDDVKEHIRIWINQVVENLLKNFEPPQTQETDENSMLLARYMNKDFQAKIKSRNKPNRQNPENSILNNASFSRGNITNLSNVSKDYSANPTTLNRKRNTVLETTSTVLEMMSDIDIVVKRNGSLDNGSNEKGGVSVEIGESSPKTSPDPMKSETHIKNQVRKDLNGDRQSKLDMFNAIQEEPVRRVSEAEAAENLRLVESMTKEKRESQNGHSKMAKLMQQVIVGSEMIEERLSPFKGDFVKLHPISDLKDDQEKPQFSSKKLISTQVIPIDNPSRSFVFNNCYKINQFKIEHKKTINRQFSSVMAFSQHHKKPSLSIQSGLSKYVKMKEAVDLKIPEPRRASQKQERVSSSQDNNVFGGLKFDNKMKTERDIGKAKRMTNYPSISPDVIRSSMNVEQANGIISLGRTSVLDFGNSPPAQFANICKKIIIYESKLEQLKESLFANDTELFPKIINNYGFKENKKYKFVSFGKFIKSIGFQISDVSLARLQLFIQEIYRRSEDEADTDDLLMIEFARFIMPKKQIDKIEARFNSQSFELGELVAIEDDELRIMKNLLLVFNKKIEDLIKIVMQTSKNQMDEMFQAGKGNSDVVSKDRIIGLLGQFGMPVQADHAYYVLRDFKSEEQGWFGKQSFEQFFKMKVWNND